MDISFIIIATQRYSEYAVDLVASLISTQKCEFEIFLFTDNCVISARKIFEQVHVIPVYHDTWPAMTMQRFQFILDIGSRISGKSIVYLDADTFVVQDLSSINEYTHVTFVKHPGFWRPSNGAEARGMGTWEDRPQLECFVPPELRINYVCGGVWFGPAKQILRMCEVLTLMMATDLGNNLTAIWHDESYTNWYHSYIRSDAVDPSYAYVAEYKHLAELTPKILVLEKPTDWVRT